MLMLQNQNYILLLITKSTPCIIFGHFSCPPCPLQGIKQSHQILRRSGWPFEYNPKNLTFFLGTVLKLIWHISGLFDTRYQMSVCDDGKGGA